MMAIVSVLVCACSGGSPADGGSKPPDTCSFRNPIGAGQDPWVTQHDGLYYYVESQGTSIWLSHTQKLSDIKKNLVQVWHAPASGWNTANVWAPELHFIGDHWYIYYAAGQSGPPYIYQRAGVLESAGTDALGPYSDKGMLFTGDPGGENIWAIDLTVDSINAQLYAVWSGWAQNAATDRTPQNLYIARMTNPWTITGPRVRISAPVESWEVGTELSLEEGPELLTHGSDEFIIYSTRESWLKDYQLGQLRLGRGADPMDPASWTKTGPVFQGTGDVYGVGHASFTRSPDGTQDWIVYHTKVSLTPGWDREIHMQPFTWNADGSPAFGTPTPPSRSIPRPSGECAS